MFRLSLVFAVIFSAGLITALPLENRDDDFTFDPKESKEDIESGENTNVPKASSPESTESEEPQKPVVDSEELSASKENLTHLKNSSADLFVIRTVVYEIGILTDGNYTDFDNESHEQIDVSFFDPENNGTFVDLSNIPIPVQTNVSGVTITGLLPANFGDLALLKNGTPTVEGSHFPLLPNKQVKVTHNVSTFDKNKSNLILSGLPDILGLKDFIKFDDAGWQQTSQESNNKSEGSNELNEKAKGGSNDSSEKVKEQSKNSSKNESIKDS